MEEYLLSIGILPELVGFYADLLSNAGWNHEDDLLLEEPSLEDLERAGVDDEQDRLRIYYAVHPEEAPVGGGDDLLDHYTSAILAGEDPTLALGLQHHHDFHDDPYGDDYYDDYGLDADDIEARLQSLQAELEQIDGVRQAGDDWAVAMNNDIVIPFDKESFQRAYALLESGNTPSFIASLEGLDINMQDPEDKNTLLHWAVSFNNPAAAQALIERGSGQYMNKYAKTPVELALEAYENGDSSFFKIRNILGLHAQELLRKVRG